MNTKKVLHFAIVQKFGLEIRPEEYKRFSCDPSFTFYRLETEVEKDRSFTFFVTNYDPRGEDKGGYKGGILPENIWCLFTFLKGKKAIIFLSAEMLREGKIEWLQEEMVKMFKRLQ
jgi:hypothetical protein